MSATVRCPFSYVYAHHRSHLFKSHCKPGSPMYLPEVSQTPSLASTHFRRRPTSPSFSCTPRTSRSANIAFRSPKSPPLDSLSSLTVSSVLLFIRVSPRRMGVLLSVCDSVLMHTINMRDAPARQHPSIVQNVSIKIMCLAPDVLYRGICFAITRVLRS